jgi:hypothetical protein
VFLLFFLLLTNPDPNPNSNPNPNPNPLLALDNRRSMTNPQPLINNHMAVSTAVTALRFALRNPLTNYSEVRVRVRDRVRVRVRDRVGVRV